MPKGPNGQKRPADAIGLAVMIGKIATGEIEDDVDATKLKEIRGSAGGVARKSALSPARRKEIASTAAKRRWLKEAAEQE